MLDTNVFNWLVQGDLSIDDLPSGGEFVATPVQRAELEATRTADKRETLLAKFSELVANLHAAPFTLDIPGAGLDQGRWTDAKLANAIRSDLDYHRKKMNNVQDALILETAIEYNCTLVTCDGPLRHVAEANKCQVLFFERPNRHRSVP